MRKVIKYDELLQDLIDLIGHMKDIVSPSLMRDVEQFEIRLHQLSDKTYADNVVVKKLRTSETENLFASEAEMEMSNNINMIFALQNEMVAFAENLIPRIK